MSIGTFISRIAIAGDDDDEEMDQSDGHERDQLDKGLLTSLN